jgi:hypothetical protein
VFDPAGEGRGGFCSSDIGAISKVNLCEVDDDGNIYISRLSKWPMSLVGKRTLLARYGNDGICTYLVGKRTW